MLEAKEKSNNFCPYRILRLYIHSRQRFLDKTEQFFVFRDRSPVTSAQFRSLLKVVLKKGGFDPDNYGSHGFCAGRALDLLNKGISVETIKKLGCWKSNAVFAYLKGC